MFCTKKIFKNVYLQCIKFKNKPAKWIIFQRNQLFLSLVTSFDELEWCILLISLSKTLHCSFFSYSILVINEFN